MDETWIGTGINIKEKQILILGEINKNNIKKYEGVYSDPVVFNVIYEEVESFDKNFPPKEKLVLPGQLN